MILREQQFHVRRIVMMAATIGLALLASCNPYGCQAEHRFAEYKGRLGIQIPLTEELSASDSGRIYFSLDEYRGAGGQNQVPVSVNVWGFASTVSEVHVHQRSGAGSGRLLFGTSSGYLVRDSVWNGYPQIYSGPGSWSDLWDTLNDDNAYLELHPAAGGSPVQARLTLARSRGFQPSCT
ncbi:MAG: hypothetical protein H0U59_05395 [Gemmatimonadaceae bacterium]|nr:hypothetical protein [Gemmatimonadaceae bacterium]